MPTEIDKEFYVPVTHRTLLQDYRIRKLARELAKQIEKQREECDWHVPTGKLVELLEDVLKSNHVEL